MDATPDASDPSPRPSSGTVVVGLAPEPQEQQVLDRAVQDTVRSELARVLAVVVVEPPPFGWLRTEPGPVGDLAALATTVRARLGWAGRQGPPRMDLRVVEGAPVATLTDVSAGCAGLYLGRGPVPTVGPVALGCASAARCPVTLVPADEAPGTRGPVVVGLDDSQYARAAVEHAIDEGGRVRSVVLVISVFDGSRGGMTDPGAGDEVRRAVEVRTRSTVRDLLERRVRSRRPGVSVEVRVLEGPPAGVLCDVAGRVGASLLVVGARGRGHVGGGSSPIGSVATRVVLRAPGAVRIIRGRLR